MGINHTYFAFFPFLLPFLLPDDNWIIHVRTTTGSELEQVTELPLGSSSFQRVLWRTGGENVCSLELSGALRLWSLQARLPSLIACWRLQMKGNICQFIPEELQFA